MKVGIRRVLRLAATLVLIALAVFGPRGARAASDNVNIVNFAFQPSTTTISAGDSVTWTWSSANSGTPHSTSSDSTSAVQWDSGIRSSGSFTVTFSTPGTFTYHCNVHPFMTGTITVMANATAVPSATPTTTTSPAPTVAAATATLTTPPPPSATPTSAPASTATPTATSIRSLHLSVAGNLARGHNSTLKLSITANGKPVGGASVALDGRKVGMGAVRHARTNAHGRAAFHHCRPSHVGTVTVRAAHSGYRSVIKKLSVHR